MHGDFFRLTFFKLFILFNFRRFPHTRLGPSRISTTRYAAREMTVSAFSKETIGAYNNISKDCLYSQRCIPLLNALPQIN